MNDETRRAAVAHALLDDGELSQSLYSDVLLEFEDEMKLSLNNDTDDALICLVEDDGDVALMLVEWDYRVVKNEVARDRLKEMWRANYTVNCQKLFPVFISQLEQGMLAVAGLKWV